MFNISVLVILCCNTRNGPHNHKAKEGVCVCVCLFCLLVFFLFCFSSETSFHIFIAMASRRIEADRFFTSDFTPEVMTSKGRLTTEYLYSSYILRRLFKETKELQCYPPCVSSCIPCMLLVFVAIQSKTMAAPLSLSHTKICIMLY